MALFCDVPVMPQRAMRLQQTNIRNVCSYITHLFGVRSGMMLVCVSTESTPHSADNWNNLQCVVLVVNLWKGMFYHLPIF